MVGEWLFVTGKYIYIYKKKKILTIVQEKSWDEILVKEYKSKLVLFCQNDYIIKFNHIYC